MPDEITHLRTILVAMDSDAQVIDLAAVPHTDRAAQHGYSANHSVPEFAVVDCDGDSVGCGASEAAAIASAILRAYNSSVAAYDKLRDAVRAVRKANSELAEL